MKSQISSPLALLLTISCYSTTAAAERPVKELKEVERIILGTWESEDTLDEDVEGLGAKGTKVQSHDEGRYSLSKRVLRTTNWLTNADKKVEALNVYLTEDPATRVIKFYLFDMIGDMAISGIVYVDGDTYYLRGEGEFLPVTEEDKEEFGTEVVPWNSEMMVTVADENTAKWKLNFVKIRGESVPFAGVGEEVICRRVK